MALPRLQTSRYGDMLKEFYQGMKEDTLSAPRLDDIQRTFNELWDVIQKRDVGRRLVKPEIYQPDFTSSPLRVWHCVFSTDAEIVNNTETIVTFENSWGDNSIFDFYNGDKSKIAINRSKFNVRLDGMVKWESSATGYRYLRMFIYDQNNTEIASQSIHGVAAANGADTVAVIAYTENIRAIFPNVAYIVMKVTQTSGAGLDLQNFVLSVSIA